MPKIAYALLRLRFRTPEFSLVVDEDTDDEYLEPELLTVAVNEELIDRLIATLSEARKALDKTQRLAESLTDLTEEENSNVTPSTK